MKTTIEFNFEAEFSAVLKLSPKEFEVFQLLGRGEATSDIAYLIGVSTKTITTHGEHIKRKLNLNTMERVRWFSARYDLASGIFGVNTKFVPVVQSHRVWEFIDQGNH